MTLREMMKNDDISQINIDALNNIIEDYHKEMKTTILPHHLEDIKDDLKFLCELRDKYNRKKGLK